MNALRLTVRDSLSPLGLATRGNGGWEQWDRYLTLDGKDAYQVGNVCGTCPFFFERLDAAGRSLSPEELRRELTEGIERLDRRHVDPLADLLPDGEYEARLIPLIPRLVMPGAPSDYFGAEQTRLWTQDGFRPQIHNPRTAYYRGDDRPLGDGAHFFEFLVPMVPIPELDAHRVTLFERALESGGRPTALAVSILDVKAPCDREGEPEFTEHWCLAHYLLDGHHKVFAAARTGRPIGLVSLLALREGYASHSQRERLKDLTASRALPS